MRFLLIAGIGRPVNNGARSFAGVGRSKSVGIPFNTGSGALVRGAVASDVTGGAAEMGVVVGIGACGESGSDPESDPYPTRRSMLFLANLFLIIAQNSILFTSDLPNLSQ